MAGGVVVIVKGPNHLEPGQHPIDPIKLPTRGLRIEMAARQHRGQRVISTGAAGKNVAHLVDLDLTPGLTGPAYEHISSLAIHLCQGHTTHPAAWCCPDPGHLHQRLPESRTTNTERFHASPSLPAALPTPGFFDTICNAGQRLAH